MKFGRFYEEFKVGDVYEHWPGRTISEADDTWFSLLTQNQNPLHIDAHYTKEHTSHGKPLVNGILIMAIGVGQSVPDVSGRAIANLGYMDVEHLGPTFHGDTIYSRSTVVSLRETSKGDTGIVETRLEIRNQREIPIMSLRRKTLVPKRGHPTLGEGKLPQDRGART
ncbi:MAG: MaoC family dehydratase [SAR202 cluster bacterium]|nr:MaoC family dehydratase [SAR202 cluster bacterium]